MNVRYLNKGIANPCRSLDGMERGEVGARWMRERSHPFAGGGGDVLFPLPDHIRPGDRVGPLVSAQGPRGGEEYLEGVI